jgi:quercetin dioxygenase-like cupin family protein
MTLFENFDKGTVFANGKLINAEDIPWNAHAKFKGVSIKHLVKAEHSNGMFSCHLVRVEPNHCLGKHEHETQVEIHETVEGSGICIVDGQSLEYKPGVIGIMQIKAVHEINASDEGILLLAKFIPALC